MLSGKGGPLAVADIVHDNTPTLVYNFEVAQDHSYFAGREGAWSHNGVVFHSGGVKGIIYSGDHGPPHLHIVGGGVECRVGQNGKPILKDGPLTPVQQRVIKENLDKIRDAIRKSMKEFRNR